MCCQWRDTIERYCWEILLRDCRSTSCLGRARFEQIAVGRSELTKIHKERELVRHLGHKFGSNTRKSLVDFFCFCFHFIFLRQHSVVQCSYLATEQSGKFKFIKIHTFFSPRNTESGARKFCISLVSTETAAFQSQEPKEFLVKTFQSATHWTAAHCLQAVYTAPKESSAARPLWPFAWGAGRVWVSLWDPENMF